ncbi:DUF6578 domain-containing protein [Streptomyces sp. NPDC001920]
MGLWHVYYADWQMECCGTPFSLGDEVSWPLLLSDADDVLGGGWHDQLTEIAGPVRDLPGDLGAVRVVADGSGLTVALHGHPVDVLAEEELGDVRPGDQYRSTGLLTVETHGDPELPETRGWVRAIQILGRQFAETPPGSGTREPVPAQRSLRSARACPKWFPDAAAGVIVALDVPDTDSRLSSALREARGIPADRSGSETTGLPPADLAALLETLSTTAMP